MNWSDYWVLLVQALFAIVILTFPVALALQLWSAAVRRNVPEQTKRIL